MMTNARKQAHKNVEMWIITARLSGASVKDLLAAAEELYEEGEMPRADYRIAIYILSQIKEAAR